MVEAAASGTLGQPTGGRSGGKPGSFHRSAYLDQSGGPHPHSDRPTQSLLSRQLASAGFDIATWKDLAAFEVAVLHPGRTLIEKLLRINNFASDPEAQDGVHGWPRIGRQFYDVWALLGTPEVLTLLREQPLISQILASCFEISLAFVPDKPLPPGGFGASAAFDLDGPLAARLRAEHEVAMRDLYYGTEEPPTFDDVLARVSANRELLDIEAAS